MVLGVERLGHAPHQLQHARGNDGSHQLCSCFFKFPRSTSPTAAKPWSLPYRWELEATVLFEEAVFFHAGCLQDGLGKALTEDIKQARRKPSLVSCGIDAVQPLYFWCVCVSSHNTDANSCRTWQDLTGMGISLRVHLGVHHQWPALCPREGRGH